MKKVLYLALVALVALPLMYACKDRNDDGKGTQHPYDPDKPSESVGSETWFEYWTSDDETANLEIKEENLLGVWQLRAYAMMAEGEEKPMSCYDPAVTWEEYLYYYEILADHTDTMFIVHNHKVDAPDITTMQKRAGKWSLTGAMLHLNNEMRPGAESEEVHYVDYTIELLEKDRMVLTRPGADMGCKTVYEVYVRTDKPATPKTKHITERLTENKWKVSNDQDLIIGVNPSQIDTLEIKKNAWRSYQMTFAAQKQENEEWMLLTISDTEGTVVEKDTLLFDYGDDYFGLRMKILPAGEQTVIFGKELYFSMLDYTNFNKLHMNCDRTVETRKGYNDCFQSRQFDIEVVK